jgi:hypothetical protein
VTVIVVARKGERRRSVSTRVIVLRSQEAFGAEPGALYDYRITNIASVNALGFRNTLIEFRMNNPESLASLFQLLFFICHDSSQVA